jgi:carbon-monoxide dehydrogenase medium subunit
MKPAPFEYFRPESVTDAVALLARHAGRAKLLAGGQSLVPLMNFRLLRPDALIDINRLSELKGIEEREGGLRIGALTRHAALEFSAVVRARFPVLAEAMAHVAHRAIRNRGTIGGSLAHADPAAELPLIAVLLDAGIRTRSASGSSSHAAQDFFVGPLTTTLADDEIVTEVALPPLPPGTGSAFAEVAMRGGDFAIAAVAATMTVADGKIAEARLAVTGMGEVPLRLGEVEAAVTGHHPSPELIEAAARQARTAVEPASDLRASADYRRHLVGVLTERVLTQAWASAA